MVFFGLFGILFLFASLGYAFTSVEPSKFITYKGKLLSAEQVAPTKRRRYRLIRRKSRIEVGILYDDSHFEVHIIHSSLNLKKLEDIRNRLDAAKGEPVIVSFQPNDRTVAEIRTLTGEVLMPVSQLKESNRFTATMLAISGAFFLAVGVFSNLLRTRDHLKNE